LAGRHIQGRRWQFYFFRRKMTGLSEIFSFIFLDSRTFM
jgi:hypothetical protein